MRCGRRSTRSAAARSAPAGRSRSSTARASERPSASRPELALHVEALGGLPEVRPDDDLGELLASALPPGLASDDVIVVAHKVVSKAEGRLRYLGGVEPGERARALAADHDKDPRAVQVVLDETAELLRAERGVLICVTHHGFVCANAGVDASNSADPEELILLPAD